ncbi:MAG: hypothetical protein IPL61_08535 [Myxococcales bacterium]|nr:hypothetical protein [Myxococcales bacterium]
MKPTGSILPLLAALLALLGACTSSDDGRATGRVTRVTAPEDAIDERLMLALSQAKNFHHKAKVYMSDGKPELAIAAVRGVLAVEFPAGAPEADDVRADARALLAKLLLARGEADAAMSELDAGLASATRESFFVANLYTVRGEVLEAQAAKLDGSTTPDDVTRARELRRQAIVAYDKSIAINAALQQRLMERR